MQLGGNLVDVVSGDIYPARITFDDVISEVKEVDENFKNYILPGFIDAHLHIESSLLCPSRFAEVVVPYGTTCVIADPHEIANVLGVDGIEYMINDSKQVPLKIYFSAPSCVPATKFETSGAELDTNEIEELLESNEIVGLGEVMNFPGVLGDDPDLLRKIEVARQHDKKVDGHAPKLTGEDLAKYVSHGISTDHECTSYEEAKEKAELGVKVMIREGSTKNMEDLIPIANEYDVSFVTDDMRVNDLLEGHMNSILRKAVALGLDPIRAIKSVTINPASHYNLPCGSISPGRSADLVEVSDLENFDVGKVFIDGEMVAKNGKASFEKKPMEMGSNINVNKKEPKNFKVRSNNSEENVRVIQLIKNSLITRELIAKLSVKDDDILPSTEDDILKIAVVERYGHNNIATGFIKGFNLKRGAIASSIAHDSHNIIVVGVDNKSIADAVNEIIDMNGGLVAVDGETAKLELPVAGLMSMERGEIVSEQLEDIHEKVKELGCTLSDPFSTLSFMALLVIPELKLSDKGLFDSKNFKLVPVIV